MREAKPDHFKMLVKGQIRKKGQVANSYEDAASDQVQIDDTTKSSFWALHFVMSSICLLNGRRARARNLPPLRTHDFKTI